jgi:hypothetical protein
MKRVIFVPSVLVLCLFFTLWFSQWHRAEAENHDTHTHSNVCVSECKERTPLMVFCFCCEITRKMFIELQLVPSMYTKRASSVNFIYDFQS